MLAVASLLVIVLIGLLITRIATAALVATGLSREYARFQSRSAFTGVGFTTSEAESVVGHPVRRRVVMTLMLLGNAGIASVVAGLLISFDGSDGSDATQRLAVLAAGLLGIWIVASNHRVDRALRRTLATVLERFTDLDARDYAQLLRVSGDYVIDELAVEPGDWLAENSLRELGLRAEGVVVLGIERQTGFLGAPGPDTHIIPGDVLVLYGRHDVITDLDQRRQGIAGELAHTDRAGDHARQRRAEMTRI